MRYMNLLFLFTFIPSATTQMYNTLLLSRMNGVRYQCADSGCAPSNTIFVGNVRGCEIACLSDLTCRTLVYDQFSSRCDLFADIPTQYGSLIAQADVVTMTAIDDRQLSARAANSTTTATTTSTATQTTTSLSFPLVGVTVAGYGNGTYGSASDAAKFPWGLAITANGTFYVSHYGNYRVMKMKVGTLTGSVVAGTGVQGNDATRLYNPTQIAVDTANNVYIADSGSCRVMLWRNNATFGIPVVGNGTCGSSTGLIGVSVGLAVDSQGYIYVADDVNHRVTKWTANATSGVVIAGTSGVAGNTNQRLNRPYALHLDENNSYIYIADLNNHRVQRCRLDDATNGTTVAGGNGAGNGSHQLNQPYGVFVSKKTGDVYVVDKNNFRVQRWSPGAASGTTVVGITGVRGINATLLNGSGNVAMDPYEAYLYVSDTDNHRVQRYKLF